MTSPVDNYIGEWRQRVVRPLSFTPAADNLMSRRTSPNGGEYELTSAELELAEAGSSRRRVGDGVAEARVVKERAGLGARNHHRAPVGVAAPHGGETMGVGGGFVGGRRRVS